MNENIKNNSKYNTGKDLEYNEFSDEYVKDIDLEIGFKDIYQTIKRNKSLLAKITVSSVIFSLIFAFTQKRIWIGNFQIVLSS